MATIKEWKHTNGYEVGETLPSVSPDDNGKVLGVSDGAWAVVSGGGGGNSGLVVHVNSVDSNLVLDKTWQEIWDAYSAGTFIVILDDTIEGEEMCNAVASVSVADLSVEASGNTTYYAETADDYPLILGGEA